MKYREKFALITFIIIFTIISAAGYLFNVPHLKTVVFCEDGFYLRFLALPFSMLVSYLIYYCTNKLKKD